MLADLATLINEYWDVALLLMLSGACFALAGLIWVIVWRRRDLTLDLVDVPAYVPPTRPLLARHRREDAETHAIPSIPGATPELHRFLDNVVDVTAALRAIEHEEVVTGVLLARVRDGLTDGDDRGSEPTQVVDLCPLTTLEFEIPAEGESPLFRETFIRYPHAELTTQNLTAALERAKESVA